MAEILGLPKAAGPATHALVLGVSNYPFADGPQATPQGQAFGIENLSSAARSASAFAVWLMKEYRNPFAELASLRVLLSPSTGETFDPGAEPILRDLPPGTLNATRAAVETDLVGFRDACRENSDNVAFVYLAGHGVQLNKRGAIVLLEDFGGPGQLNLLHGAIDAIGCQLGLDATGFARHQFWFVDACRQQPAVARKFEELSGALKLDEGIGRVESTPVFLASSTREAAFSQVGGTSLFCQALIWALQGAAASGPSGDCPQWHVATSGLLETLQPRVAELAAEFGELQNVDVGGRPGLGIAQRFQQPPAVELTISIDPAEAAGAAAPRLLLGGRTPVNVAPGWPLVATVPAGAYTLQVTAQPPYASMTIPLNVAPPRCTDSVEVET